jgi:anaerobic C4-dicarboxylate transporter
MLLLQLAVILICIFIGSRMSGIGSQETILMPGAIKSVIIIGLAAFALVQSILFKP